MYKFFSKRPKNIENQIIDRWEPSVVHKDVFSKNDIKQLISIFKKAPKAGPEVKSYKMFDDALNAKDFKHTLQKKAPRAVETTTACSAPICWDSGSSEILDPVLTKCIGDYKIIGGKFNLTLGPNRLHTDSGKDPTSKIYKQTIIPLYWDTSLNIYSMFFNQRWTGCQARFQRGVSDNSSESFSTPSHMTITDYENSDIYNLTNKSFDIEDYKKYVTHINYESLWGFSIEQAAKWERHSLMAFDRSVIHSSCHFANKELENKLYITLVTEQL